MSPLILALTFLLLLCGTGSALLGQSGEVTSISEVRALPAAEASSGGRQVRLSGVVLSVGSLPSPYFILSDGAEAMTVQLAQAMPELQLGQAVQVQGRTTTPLPGGGLKMAASASSVKITGKAELPKARPLDIPTLISRQYFDQWVSLDAFVLDWAYMPGELELRMIGSGGWITARVALPKLADVPPRMNGARLRLTGVNRNLRDAYDVLEVPSLAQVQVLEEGTEDVFATQQASVADLMERRVEEGRRYRVRGTVVGVVEQRKVMLHTAEGVLLAYLLISELNPPPGRIPNSATRFPPPQVGDEVELVGSVFTSSNPTLQSMGLNYCHLRKVGQQPVPKPRVVDLSTLRNMKNHDEWCSVEVVVTAWLQEGSMRSFYVMDAHQWGIIDVKDVPLVEFPRDLHGARVRFTGISRSLVSSPYEVLLVPGLRHVEILRPGSADPFSAPAATVGEIVAKEASADPLKTRGVVLAHSATGLLTVRGEGGALKAHLQQPWSQVLGRNIATQVGAAPVPQLIPGDEVEIVGLPAKMPANSQEKGYDLYQTLVKKVGQQGPPVATPATLEEIQDGQHTHDLVEVQATVTGIQRVSTADSWHSAFTLEGGQGATLQAVSDNRQQEALSQVSVNHVVLLRAIVEPQGITHPRQLRLVDSAHLRVLGISDKVLRRQFWLYGGSALALVLILLIWISRLRSRSIAQAKAAAELKAASDAARESEKRWKLLFEQSPLSVQIFNPEGQTIRFNQAWQKLFRLTDEQGYAFNVLTDPSLNASGAVNLIRGAFRGEVVHVPPVPYPIPGEPPETRWIGGVLYPVKTDSGELAEVVTIHHDITEAKQASEALVEMNQVLEQRVNERTEELEKARSELQRAYQQEKELGELKTRFVTMVSHEFRTPLGIIMSAVELLQHYSDRLPAEEKALQLSEIQASTRHMGSLMEQVLLLGRADAGKLSYKPQVLDVIGFAERIIDETYSISSRKCLITLQSTGELSGASLDEALLRHILGNLVANAVKYSAPGSEVILGLHRSGPNVVISIKDSGIGIPTAELDRLFEAFHRCSNVGDTPGTGLGLVIVKRCVDLHGGSIEVTSVVDKGTTFIVRLPAFIGPIE